MPPAARAALLIVLALTGTAARAAQRTPCEGLFAFPRGMEFPAYSGPPVAVAGVAVGKKTLELVGVCPTRRARIVRVRHGWKVSARWGRCGEYRKVDVRGTIDATCSGLSVRIRTRRPNLRPFLHAVHVTCGDGRVDGAEECDPPGGARCDGQCRVIPSTCGNGRVDAGEECDDGNAADDDACSLSCHRNESCDEVRFASTWAAIQSVVFERRSCTAAFCHTGATPTGGLDLSGDGVHARLVGVPSTRDPSVARVAVGDPERSLLYLKVAPGLDTGRYGSPMPFQGAPLSPEEVDALKLWIRAGAPESGVVDETAGKLRTCLPGSTPLKIEPLPPPPPDEGVQLYAPPWEIAPRGEDEVCFATWYDFTGRVPASRLLPCPADWGGAGRQCFAYTGSQFRQDPNSHHSIIYAYTGTSPPSSFGAFTCHGGAKNGQPCNPTAVGVAAPAGADCGPRAGCAGTIAHLAPGCFPAVGGSYGPFDFNTGGGVNDTPTTHGIGGAQTPVASVSLPTDVYALLPVKGIVVWNSHAFNLTTEPTTNEQWLNLEFGTGQLRHVVRPVFEDDSIFATAVPPFGQEEICRTSTFQRGARIIDLSSHTHKRGVRFRAWGPPITPCGGIAGCGPEPGPPLFTTTDYADPARVRYEPPLPLDGAADAARTFKFCALYDNGYANPATVKRKSRSPLLSLGFCGGSVRTDLSCCAETRCIGALAGRMCTTDADCGGAAGSCDACWLYGGVTTEDEMFILTGSYYQLP